MTDPNDSDDTWGDLARELGLDEPTFVSPPPDEADDEAAPVAEDVGEFEDAGIVETEPGAADPDGEDGEGEAEGELLGDDGQPGPGRKRRRRRRRRKKGGAPGQTAEAAEGGEDAAAEEPEVTDEEEPAAPVRIPVRAPNRMPIRDDAQDEEAEEIEPATVALAAEEDTGSEVLRELIATWNVPAWDDIVGGLYRPER